MKPSNSGTAVKLDEGACIFGAGVLLKHLDALEEETQGVREGQEDIEFIHRARVASRRLRASLPLFGDCLPGKKYPVWLKRIRKVTRALGEARDTDVQLERIEKFLQSQTDPIYQRGGIRLRLRLRQRRAALQTSVAKAMNKLEASGIVKEMRDRLAPLSERSSQVYMYTPALYQHSFLSINQRLLDLLAYDEIVNQPEKVKELHQMRIAAKWLRYTMENFAPLYASQLKNQLQVVRKIQEMLGDIHDNDVWLDLLPQFLIEERQRIIDFYGNARTFPRLMPGIQAFLEDCQKTRSEIYNDFVGKWQGWKEDGTWASLTETIQVPFLQQGTVYPPRALTPLAQETGTEKPPETPPEQ